MIKYQEHDLLKAWPFQEAIKLIKSFGGFDNFQNPEKGFCFI